MNKSKLPRWILLLSGVLALLEIMISITLFLAPETVAENVDIKAKGVDYLMQTWAIRQFALGVIFAFATIKRVAPMLSITFLFFSVMMLGDVWIGFAQHNMGLTVMAGVLAFLAFFILYKIKKSTQSEFR